MPRLEFSTGHNKLPFSHSLFGECSVFSSSAPLMCPCHCPCNISLHNPDENSSIGAWSERTAARLHLNSFSDMHNRPCRSDQPTQISADKSEQAVHPCVIDLSHQDWGSTGGTWTTCGPSIRRCSLWLGALSAISQSLPTPPE